MTMLVGQQTAINLLLIKPSMGIVMSIQLVEQTKVCTIGFIACEMSSKTGSCPKSGSQS